MMSPQQQLQYLWSITTILIICINSANSLYLPTCLNGFGLQNPKLAGYGGNPADCLACLDKKCGKCYKYYKKCLECLPGYSLRKGKCVPCKSPTCGMCPKNPSKCTVQQTTCEEGPVTKYQRGAKKKSWDRAQAYCNAVPGQQSNGYARNLTASISNGVCYNCASKQFVDGMDDLKYCDFVAVARSVAITSVKSAATGSCPFPSGAVPVVTKACYKKPGSYPFGDFPFYFVVNVQFCGKSQDVYVRGGWKATPYRSTIFKANKWTWMVKP